MEKKAERIEDLPVVTEQAAEVKGGGVIVDDKSLNFTNQYVSPGTIKGFNPQPDPPARTCPWTRSTSSWRTSRW